MDLAQFWEIIEEVHAGSGGDVDRKRRLLNAKLEQLSDAEVLSFMEHFDDRFDEAYRWDIWDAASVIGGGCGDDMFSNFRAGLISFGRDAFERAMRGPDSLADLSLDRASAFREGFDYVAVSIYHKRTGVIPSRKAPVEPSGVDLDQQDLERRFPRLCRKFGET